VILTLLHYVGFTLAFGGGAAVLVLMARAKASPEAAPISAPRSGPSPP